MNFRDLQALVERVEEGLEDLAGLQRDGFDPALSLTGMLDARDLLALARHSRLLLESAKLSQEHIEGHRNLADRTAALRALQELS